MKKLSLILTGTFLSFLIINGCQKVQPTTTATNVLFAVVDSNTFNSVGTSVNATKNISDLVITGLTPENVKLTIEVPGFTGFDGTVANISYGANVIFSLDSGSGAVGNIPSVGFVNFTQTFPNLVGTFYFICTDSTYVTHGKFNCVAPQ